MLKLLPEWLKLGGALMVGALIVTYPAILIGRSEGRQQAATQALESAVKRFAEKGKINGQVSSLDAAALCNDFGLPDSDKADCMRRVREASAKP
ncbi:hypothetical protein SAMN02927900_01283 [Rhizobium mongolense subsp. loessense]|uniref:Uncharacterized protein n=1 Tax=Rhizobium mongolense subsp. loessense TaxID=158890 RepID=A0A1G4Q2X9_9HYPH|nr:hypothetical protein [Rhizobium mongolense]SCW38960.1 hypothetical protein SAMN02927900_01283 [Rhizobium mongolense subsp. loessense]